MRGDLRQLSLLGRGDRRGRGGSGGKARHISVGGEHNTRLVYSDNSASPPQLFTATTSIPILNVASGSNCKDFCQSISYLSTILLIHGAYKRIESASSSYFCIAICISNNQTSVTS